MEKKRSTKKLKEDNIVPMSDLDIGIDVEEDSNSNVNKGVAS